MPLRQKLRRVRSSFGSGLNALLPGRSANSPSVSLPNAPTSNNQATRSGHHADLQYETDASRTTPDHTTNLGESANPPALVVTGITGEVTSLSQQANTSEIGQPQTQSIAGQTSRSASSFAVASSITPIDSTGTGNWASLKGIAKVLEPRARAFGPLKTVIDELVACIESYERVANGRNEFKALQAELEGIFEGLQHHLSRDAPLTITASVESLCKSILQELSYVKGKQGRGTRKRIIEVREDADGVLACYRRIQGHLQRLSLNANLSMWKVVDEHATEARLDRLRPSMSACYNSRQAAELRRGACTPGTRVDVLGGMHDWVYKQGEGSVYWLNGMAGTGKTTIAYSLCNELETGQNLGASFFCSRTLPECRDVNQIVPSIAYQLARFSRPFRWAVSQVLEKRPDVHTQLLRIQFETLVVQPLEEVRGTLPKDLVVVIDALDECDNKKSTSQILEALLTKTSDLPIKFFIASRPEPEIRDQMKKRGNRRAISRLVLHELDKGTVQGDIETYLRAALEPIKPTESEIAQLVERAGILFIYAATVARYIGYDNFSKGPRKRLNSVLNVAGVDGKNPYKDIDELYTLILQAALDDPGLEDDEKDDTKQVLYTALCAREPLTTSALSGLLGFHDIEQVDGAIRPLWSVLHVVESSGLVTTLHASFPDYMFDPKRSKNYCCDVVVQDQALTRCCLDCIKDSKTQFNICGLESSYVLDQEIADLRAMVEKAISSELLYACRYWAMHLERAKAEQDIVERLEDFVSSRLLLWMEVMNLNECMHTGAEMLRQVEDWCMHERCRAELTQMTHDAWRFATTFTSSPVSQSTPHIYVSMLPFWPESSPISKYYGTRMQGMIQAKGTAIKRRNLALLTTWSMKGEVTSVAWSPDGSRIALVANRQILVHDSLTGKLALGPLNQLTHMVNSVGFSSNGTRIVSGSQDGTIRVWDAQSGEKVLGPLKGHTGSVNSVSFSPDCAYIVSGSADMTIRVWRVGSGKKMLGPLKGHTNSVNCVAFSPNGARIVSGSSDNTIFVWDAHSGLMSLGLREEQPKTVHSVAFSPDGTRIVSGSDDNIIHMWDAQSGLTLLPGPLKGHTSEVYSVAFSPDGTRIVSGSGDNTIRMWNAQSGQTLLGPLEGHTRGVKSVAFSPDSTRIVSGSCDNTIRVWDAQSRQTVLGPLKGHTGAIYSVAFSPDGTRIVSGSHDKTIRLWDAQSGEIVPGPPKEHINSVSSVAFSPDSTRIVSGSWDQTIHIWDARSGETVLGSLTGHTYLVNSVAFSPDGTRIVSGSWDDTIRIWDAQSGLTALGPLRGHAGDINSVAFSPDSSRIISGSHDKTIRVWDAQSGEAVLSPLEGHTSVVWSVAFSPDGTRIASGSGDNTIRMWDAQSGQTVLVPLEGHTGSVMSVAFSPDGTRVVSGSEDTTILVWDTKNGQTVLGPFRGHTSLVRSVAFSPDNTRIVSGSDDKTICMWDARSEQGPSSSSRLAAPTSWSINSDGWLHDRDNESRRLLWIPADLRSVTCLPPKMIVFGLPSVQLSFGDPCIGELWTECYRPV